MGGEERRAITRPESQGARRVSVPASRSAASSCSRVHRAGWSIGHTGSATLWLVSGSNGENAISATGKGLAEAYWRACVQAREVGLLAPVRGRSLREG